MDRGELLICLIIIIVVFSFPPPCMLIVDPRTWIPKCHESHVW